MNQNRERMALFATGLSAVAALVDFLLFRKSALFSAIALEPFCALAALTSVIAYARLRLARIAEDEQRDEALARKERVDTTLFAAGDSAPFTAARSLEQFEKWILPAVPTVFALGLGIAAAWLYRDISRSVAKPQDHLLVAAFLAGQSFFFFLLGRLLLGLSREEDHKNTATVLRGPGVVLGMTCFAGLIAAVAAVAAQVGEDDPRFDKYGALALAAVSSVLALEQMLRFVTALYSPRHRRPFLTAYESRISQLATDPASWARSFASAVDYQFGFNVSESWFYRLVRNALAPLLIFQLLVLYFMSCLVFLGPEEEGVLEHFGKPVENAWKLESGFHFKLPWPFETVQRVPARRVLTTYIGFEMESETNRPAVISWSQPHYKKEDMYLVASRAVGQTVSSANAADAVAASLVSVNIPVEYRVTNLLSFVYGSQQPEKILNSIANRALTQAAARHDLSDFLGPRRAEIGDALQTRIQRDADIAGLGIEILFVGMQGVHPPVQVAEAYESVVGAIEQKEATILTARAYTNQVLPVARADAEKTLREAEAYRTRRSEIASAEVTQFEKRQQAYATAPGVFKTSMYLTALRESLANTRKYIVDAPASKKVMIFNFEEKPYQDLLDFGSTTTEKPK